MIDENEPQDKPMKVILHKERDSDVTYEQQAFDEVGISVENAVPIEELEALADEWKRGAPTREMARGKLTCAQELRSLIAEYRSGADR